MKIFLPNIYKESSKRNPPEPPEPPEPPPTSPEDEILVEALYRIIRDSPHQQRDKSKMMRHSLLDNAAFRKAQDMAEKNYFSHTSPEGISANQNVRLAGYPLPSYYPNDGNQVESIYLYIIDAGYGHMDIPENVADGWLKSEHHRNQVYGHTEFFCKQLCIGVGHASIEKEKYRGYWVFVSCPCL